ncbi:MAG: TlpA family protein disulfide reductase [Desulfovibrionales bacterium]
MTRKKSLNFMNRWKARTFFLVILLTAVVFYGHLEGLFAEDVPMIDHQELLEEIHSARGKVVIVNFWATDCPPCKIEIPELIKIRKKYSAEDVLLLGISVDMNQRKLTRYMQTHEFNYPVYWASGDVTQAFQVQAIPKMLIFDQQGGLVLKHEGFLDSKRLDRILTDLLS